MQTSCSQTARHEHVRREAQLNCCRRRGAADSQRDWGGNYPQSAELGATVFRYSINNISHLHEAVVPTGAVEEVRWEHSRGRVSLYFRTKIELMISGHCDTSSRKFMKPLDLLSLTGASCYLGGVPISSWIPVGNKEPAFLYKGKTDIFCAGFFIF